MAADSLGRTQDRIILVADDDEAVRLLAKQALNQSGFLVVTAQDGLDALSTFEQIRPDLVLLDVDMPRMDGFEVCNRIRRQPPGFYTPILIVTELDDIDSIDRAYMMGATDFLTKPVNWTVLTHRIRYILRAGKAIERRIDSEAKNQALVDALPDLIFQISRDGTFLDYRHSAGLQPYLSPDQFLGKKITEVLPPEVSDKCMSHLELAFQTKRVEQFEYSLPKKGSDEKEQFEARILVFGRDQVLGIVRDVTEQKRLLAELHQSQKMEALGLLAGGGSSRLQQRIDCHQLLDWSPSSEAQGQ